MKPKHEQRFLPAVFLVAGIVAVIVGNQRFTGGAAAIAAVLLIGLGTFSAIVGAAWLALSLTVQVVQDRQPKINVRKTLASLSAAAAAMLVIYMIRRF